MFSSKSAAVISDKGVDIVHSVLILLLTALLLNSLGTPQTPAPRQSRPEEVGEDDVVRVDTTLVGVPVTVLDRDGRFVPGLKREDFQIYENGVEQQIAYFAQVEANVTTLLLFDRFVKGYRETANAFADRMGMGDKVLVARFGDSKYEILTKADDGPAGVRKEKQTVKWHFGKHIYDAVEAAIKRMNSIPGRKAILLYSDGLNPPETISVTIDMSERELSRTEEDPLQRATALGNIREAAESDAPFYVLQYDTMTDAVRQGPNPKNSATLNSFIPEARNWYRIAYAYLHLLVEKTGGRIYQVASGPGLNQAKNPPGLAQAFTEISAELQQQYSLGYYPKDKANDLHQIKVRVAKPGVVVRSRTSYTPLTSKP